MLFIIGVVMLYPIWFVIIASISDPIAVNSGDVVFLPIGFQLEGYSNILRNEWILIGYRNSLIYAFFGTLFSLTLTFPAGYVLSRKDVFGHKLITLYLLITMFFNGGLIPTFLVVRDLNLLDRPFTLIILGAVSVFNIILCRVYIQSSIPGELQEAARIDGCSDFGILFKIILPLSAPILAVLALFYGMARWNDFFTALIYISTRQYNPLQIFLREILIQNAQFDVRRDIADLAAAAERARLAQVMRYGLVVVSSLPMLILYPFVQRYFVKGVMIGALKG